MAAMAVSVVVVLSGTQGASARDFALPLGIEQHAGPSVPRSSPLRPSRLRAAAAETLDATSGTEDAAADRRKVLGSLAIGLVAGGLGGALGLGGGFLVVPAMCTLLGTEPRKAVGTSAMVVLAVSCVACRTYVARGLASWRAAGCIALAALLTARVGASMTARTKPAVLKRAFGGYLMLVSAIIGLKAAGLLMAGASIRGAGAVAPIVPLLGLGAVTGFVSGLLGVGGGTVLVPSLTLAFSFPQPEAQGCALLGMVPPAVVSSSTHLSKGNVDSKLVWGAVLGAMVGGAGGSYGAAMLPERTLRICFAVVLACVGLKYASS